jgi:hypothetical protein
MLALSSISRKSLRRISKIYSRADSEEHDRGSFNKNAFAILERTDELIDEILAALPETYDFVLVSAMRLGWLARLPPLNQLEHASFGRAVDGHF